MHNKIFHNAIIIYFINSLISDSLEISFTTYVCRNLDFLMSTISHKVTVPAISGYLASPCAFATWWKRVAWTNGRTDVRTNSRIFIRTPSLCRTAWKLRWTYNLMREGESNRIKRRVLMHRPTGAYICRFVLKTVQRLKIPRMPVIDIN